MKGEKVAMFWPEQKVALDIVDDVLAEHIAPDDLPADWNVLRVTMAQTSTLEGLRELGGTLCMMLGVEPPEKTPEWLGSS